VYCGADGEVPGKFRLRKGETLGVVDGLRAFGSQRKEMAAAVKLVHSWGATIVDADTGMNSRDDGVEMLDAALTPQRLTSEQASAMAKLMHAKKKDGRAEDSVALRAWHNPNIIDAVQFRELTGWPESTAYAKFGPRFSIAKKQKRRKSK